MTSAGHRLVPVRLRVLPPLLVLVVVLIALAAVPGLRHYLAGRPSAQVADKGLIVAAAGDIACAAGPGAAVAGEDDDAPAPAVAVGALPSADSGRKAGAAAGSTCAQAATATLLQDLHPVAVLPLGDTQYECGSGADLALSYAATWGRSLAITHPAIGNHEYGRACGRDDASAYFDYFGAAAGPRDKGWYSYDLGSWHVIALNSQCSYGKRRGNPVGGCATGSEQERWLRDDLKAHPARCTLAYWHQPRFSSGQHGDAVQMTDIWNDLVQAHADVVLSGHNHVYERFDRLGSTTTPDGTDAASTTTGQPAFQSPQLDPAGIRQFVVGTGGKNHYPFRRPPLPGEQARDDRTFGVLVLTLRATGYDWQFRPVLDGSFSDRGTSSCR